MRLLLGDCKTKLKELEDNSIDAIVTDPPYELGFMGKDWDNTGIANDTEMWRECLRVLKPGGYLLSFSGTRTYHRMAVAIEGAGFEIRDMIAWVYGSGFPKSHNIGKAVDKLQGNEIKSTYQPNYKNNKYGKGLGGGTTDNTPSNNEWNGWGTALKPALEPITVARKPLSEKSVAENCLKWGVGGINIDGCRVGIDKDDDIHAKNPHTVHIKSNLEFTSSNGEAYKVPTGRFPANLIHDGSDEVVGLFPQTGKGNGGSAYNYAGKEYDNKDTSMFNGDKPQAPSNFNDSGSASRFFYCAKASKRERNIGCEGLEESIVNDGRETDIDNAFQRGITLRKNTHPTVKPLALMEYLVKLVSREGQVVLDPFMGSGTTGMACKKLDREFIGIEMMEEYMEIAKARIEGVELSEEEIMERDQLSLV